MKFLMLHCSNRPTPEYDKPCDTMIGVSLPIDDTVLRELEDDGWIMMNADDENVEMLLPTCPECARARGVDKEMAQLIGLQRRARLGDEDRNAPWVCTGCSKVYPTCPDHDAHDCPGCGEKVCPARLWARAVVRCEKIAEHLCGILTAERTGTNMTCKCGIAYRLHPHCAHSKLGPEQSSSVRPEYFLHVICDGRHVKL